MNRLWKPILGLLAVLAAFTLTFGWPRQNGLEIDIDTSPRAQAARLKDPYDLTKLQVLNRTVLEVKDHYVEPGRLEYQRMLLAGLNAIQRSVPPVLVDYEEGHSTLRVHVNGADQEFAIHDVDSPWALTDKFRQIFAFLQKHLQDEADLDLREVEYAAVNGMLRTLDPHTVLLTPDIFEEMQTSTRGEFGGLGIVISIREGHLTVIKPMEGTPAYRAGLQRRDRIVKINEESTLNMPLSEAVNRLRGMPGSKVTVWIRRKGAQNSWGPAKRVELTRAVIHIESVEHRMLKSSIGYIKINNFQGNTHQDLRQALRMLHRKKLQGLILDLRSNPGGLLDQAVRVADTFLESGPIVTTSSQDPRQRDEKFARKVGTEPDYPMIVLINGASASASEIVAGALQNHDRALIVGQQSFGKGSVQVLYNFQDGSALKLTVAQYLTPGDVSIQGVGIVPDIAIDAMTVDREDMDLEVDEGFVREEDLRAHLTHESASTGRGSELVLHYYLNSDLRQRLREAEPNEEENEEEETFLISFSRKLLASSKRPGRREMLQDATRTIAQIQKQEMNQTVAQLKKIGVDWSVGANKGDSDVQVVASTDRPKNKARAGEPFALKVAVTNKGSHTLYQLRATTKSDNRLFDGRELVFGKLKPGQTRQWSTTLGVCTTEDGKRSCRVPRDTPNRADGIRLEFQEAHGRVPEPVVVRTEVQALPRPRFAYSYQIADNLRGNGDGHLQKGERATLYVQVKNIGEGRSYQTQANLRNKTGRGVLLQDGRFESEGMKPGEQWVIPFTFEVLPDHEGKEAKLEFAVIDTELRISIGEKLTIRLDQPQLPVEDTQGALKTGLRDGAFVRAAPEQMAPVVAKALDTPTVALQAKSGGFARVDLGGGRPGWVATGDLTRVLGQGTVQFVLPHMPPRLNLNFGDALVTRAPKMELRGDVFDDQRVRDLYIFAGARKVFYTSNQKSANPREMSFSSSVPLHPGINYLTIIARESDDSVTREMVVVRRDGADGELLETPKYDDEIFGHAP